MANRQPTEEAKQLEEMAQTIREIRETARQICMSPIDEEFLLTSKERQEVICGIPPRKLGEDYTRLCEAIERATILKAIPIVEKRAREEIYLAIDTKMKGCLAGIPMNFREDMAIIPMTEWNALREKIFGQALKEEGGK